MPRVRQDYFDDMASVGRRLREAREALGLSQRDLAFPGCTAAYISRIEKGQRVPSLQLMSRLAARVAVPTHWLAWGCDPASEDSLQAQLERAEIRIRVLEGRLAKIAELAEP